MLKSKLVNRLILYLLLVVILAVLYFIPDRILFDNKYSLCLHKIILGIECPLCGMTRAAHELLNFRFLSAFQYNFTIYILSLFILIDLIYYSIPVKTLRKLRKVVLTTLLTGFGILYALRIGFYFGWL